MTPRTSNYLDIAWYTGIGFILGAWLDPGTWPLRILAATVYAAAAATTSLLIDRITRPKETP